MAATKPNALGAPGYSETLPCVMESAGTARRLVRAALETWNLGTLVEDAELVVSELASNSITHSGSRLMRVAVDRIGDYRVCIAVSDKSRQAPAAGHVSDEDESGRGLFLVEAFAERWDTDYRAWGKVVWAELVAKPASCAEEK
ncbi:ATP-binding protein [Streptomyces alfalfae]|uniref:ATP-binding protein n=1 Tax=Streptomyces alfalfae TaxID=1642299 RepID=UPI001BA72B79|nr:ATP-binding protein [Streptomyces alfalfae]QUI35727.1 ATP-binding protein [Streptomyces alfalfae]